MTTRIARTTVTFCKPFFVEGLEEKLPAGRYELESEQETLDGIPLPDCLRTSVLIHLHAKVGSPALAQTLTIPWEALERAQMRDQAPAGSLPGLALAGILADPIVRLVMLSDGVSEAEVRGVVKAARRQTAFQLGCVDDTKRARLPSQSRLPPTHAATIRARETADRQAVDRGENEGMALRPAWSCACGAERRRATGSRLGYDWSEADLRPNDNLIEEASANVYTE